MAWEFPRLFKTNSAAATYRDRMLDFQEVNALFGLPELLAEGKEYASDERDGRAVAAVVAAAVADGAAMAEQGVG